MANALRRLPRVLVVDDDEVSLDDLRNQLGGQVDEVLVAVNPRDAISILERTEVDALICDFGLGPTSGLDLLDEVRLRWPRVARVLLAGQEDLLSMVETSPAAQAVIGKPCEVALLAALLLRLPLPSQRSVQ